MLENTEWAIKNGQAMQRNWKHGYTRWRKTKTNYE